MDLPKQEAARPSNPAPSLSSEKLVEMIKTCDGQIRYAAGEGSYDPHWFRDVRAACLEIQRRRAVETAAPLTVSGLDALIAEADKYVLPVDVKIGAATFRQGVKVGTMLRGLKSHAERQIATAYSSEKATAHPPDCQVCELPAHLCTCMTIAEKVEAALFGDVKHRGGDFLSVAADVLKMSQADVDAALAAEREAGEHS